MQKLCELIGEVRPMLATLTSGLKSTGIDIANLQIDHVCYRSASIEEYCRVCKAVGDEHGSLIVEGMIGGRPISCYLLNEPIRFEEWSIPVLELPCPKPGRSHTTGLEHMEVVIGTSASTAYASSAKPELELFMSKHADVAFDTRALEKDFNPDVSLSFEEFSVKFHCTPLLDVCTHEKEMGLVKQVPPNFFDGYDR